MQGFLLNISLPLPLAPTFQNHSHKGAKSVYKSSDKRQLTFDDFNQPMGLKMDPNNRWIKLEDSIPWNQFEEKYATLFSSNVGNIAKPLRMALGSLIIQTKYGISDRELVEQLTENPYYQYFIGLPGYEAVKPFDASLLVDFRKRIDFDMLNEINIYILDAQNNENDKDDTDHNGDNDVDTKEPESSTDDASDIPNKGTLIIDATCAPSNIRYPQDYSLLNEAREKLEGIIDRFCKDYSLKKPRMYRVEARKNYLKLAKTKKRTKTKIRATIRKQLGYVKRNLGYLEGFMSEGYAPKANEIKLLDIIYQVYEQQEYMYQTKTHSVDHRIVSISQPYLRPIVRGKTNAPVEFGAKFELSLDEHGYGRIEKLSFDAYNESVGLQDIIERNKVRTGNYPERVLADQIYRTRENRKYCKKHGIRLSGPKLGRPAKDDKINKKIEYQDNVDRIEVERSFSLSKRCYNLGLIKTKLKETTMTSIALSIFVTNLFKIQSRIFLRFNRNIQWWFAFSLFPSQTACSF